MLLHGLRILCDELYVVVGGKTKISRVVHAAGLPRAVDFVLENIAVQKPSNVFGFITRMATEFCGLVLRTDKLSLFRLSKAFRKRWPKGCF